MKTLSIRQPWAWLILNAGKDFENRDWSTGLRGRILIHAGKGMTKAEYQDGFDALVLANRLRPEQEWIRLPDFESLERGGIVGQVEITDCVDTNDLEDNNEIYPSPWLFGRFGFKLANPKPLPFRPYKGMLGFFEVNDFALYGAERHG